MIFAKPNFAKIISDNLILIFFVVAGDVFVFTKRQLVFKRIFLDRFFPSNRLAVIYEKFIQQIRVTDLLQVFRSHRYIADGQIYLGFTQLVEIAQNLFNLCFADLPVWSFEALKFKQDLAAVSSHKVSDFV